MPEKTADLHVHTTFSDGTNKPERVVELAHEAGLSAIAITDHDNTDAMAVAAPAAQRYGIELIPGIEMSASAEGLEVHVLGFLMDFTNGALVEHLATQKARRVRRVHEMVRRLQQVGLKITPEQVFAFAGEGTVGRPHVARALEQQGYVSNTAEAFTKYLGPDNPGFVPGSPLPPSEVISVIRGAGGVPVLAHPIYLKRDALIEQFVRDGLVGLEVYHSGHTGEMIQRYEQVASRLRLLKTGGSDYHGTTKEGLPIGAVKVPYRLVDELRQWNASHSQ